MTSDASPYYEAPPPPPGAPVTRGWAGGDLAIGSALIVLLVALFLPWFTETVSFSSSPTVSGTGSGVAAHGYLWVVFVLVLVGLAVVIGRDALGRLPGNLPSAEQILVLATGLAFLLSILGVIFKPSGYSISGTAAAIQQLSGHISVSVGWSYGGFVAVVAAAIAFVAAYGMTGRLHASRASQPAWEQPAAQG